MTAAVVAAAAVSLAVAAVATAVLTSSGSDSLPGEQETPNVLFIVTDDQRAGTLDVMPNTRRRFKSQGTEFPQAVAATPNCCPSRASIFTGHYAHRHTVRTNEEAGNLDQSPTTSPTLQRYLQQAGYSTAIFGKYLNDWPLSQDPPFFDRWAIFDEGYSSIEVNEQGTEKTIAQYSTRYVSDQAVAFLKQAEGDDRKPWFLYVAPFAPHPPSTPESKYANAALPAFEPSPAYFEQDLSDKPQWVRDNQVKSPTNPNNPCFGQPPSCGIERQRELMLRTLKSVDDMVKRVFAVLDTADETRDTLAFFIADNGFMWGEHGLGAKQKPYTTSIRVPMFMRWPRHVQPGAEDSRLAANIDPAPTVMDALDITPDAATDGRSLLDPAQTRTRWLTERWKLPSTAVPPGIPTWASTRTPTFQYTEYYADNGSVTDREYYDLAADPWQLTNLLGDSNPGNDPPTPALSAQLAADRTCAGQTCP